MSQQRVQSLERALDLLLRPLAAFHDMSGDTLLLELGDLRVANLLLGNAVRFRQRAHVLLDSLGERLIRDGLRPGDRRTSHFLRQRLDRFDRDLHLLVAEHDGAEHDLFRQHLGLRLDHEDRVLGAGDDEIELRVLELRSRGVQQVLAVLVADPRAADRAEERETRQRECSGSPEHRRDIRIDLGVHREHRRDHLHFALKPIGEQRPNGAIDETRRQRFLLARAALALEEAARDAARGVGLLLVIDGQRKEIASAHVLLLAHRGH